MPCPAHMSIDRASMCPAPYTGYKPGDLIKLLEPKPGADAEPAEAEGKAAEGEPAAAASGLPAAEGKPAAVPPPPPPPPAVPPPKEAEAFPPAPPPADDGGLPVPRAGDDRYWRPEREHYGKKAEAGKTSTSVKKKPAPKPMPIEQKKPTLQKEKKPTQKDDWATKAWGGGPKAAWKNHAAAASAASNAASNASSSWRGSQWDERDDWNAVALAKTQDAQPKPWETILNCNYVSIYSQDSHVFDFVFGDVL